MSRTTDTRCKVAASKDAIPSTVPKPGVPQTSVQRDGGCACPKIARANDGENGTRSLIPALVNAIAPDGEFMRLPISAIRVGRRLRGIKPDGVKQLLESISKGRQIQPVIVDSHYRLICGLQRLEACKLAGQTEIDVIMVDVSPDQAKLMEWDENLFRMDLTAFERADAIGHREQLLKRLGCVAVSGGQPNSQHDQTTVADRAHQCDMSKRRYQNYLATINALVPEVRRILRQAPDDKESPLGCLADNHSHLKQLGRSARDEQIAIVEQIRAGTAQDVAAARRRLSPLAQIGRDGMLLDSQTFPMVPAPAQFSDEPYAVLRAAVHVALQHQGLSHRLSCGDLLHLDDRGHLMVSLPDGAADPGMLAAVSSVTDVISRITAVQAVWAANETTPKCPPRKLSMDEIAALPAGQLEVRWLSPQMVEVRKAGRPIVWLPVERVTKSGTFVKIEGNTKSESVFSTWQSVSSGCFRWAVGREKCDRSCYEDDNGGGGCFANEARYAQWQQYQAQDFNVIWNGLRNDLVPVRLPADGTAVLPDADLSVAERAPFWRIDGESTCGSLSLALGTPQMLATANPDRWFTTMCAHYFRIPDAMLYWAAALPNLWCGSTVSAWFSATELGIRFAAIERMIDFGVRVVVWVCTSADWDDEPVLERALKLVSPSQIIEVPHRSSNHAQEQARHLNRGITACALARYDENGNRIEFVSGKDGCITAQVLQPDGCYAKPAGKVHARCRECPTRCGWTTLFGSR